MSKIVKHIGEIDKKISKTDLIELVKPHSSEILKSDIEI